MVALLAFVISILAAILWGMLYAAFLRVSFLRERAWLFSLIIVVLVIAGTVR